MATTGDRKDEDRLAALQAELRQAQIELKAAENELADRKREIFAFEARMESRIGDLLTALTGLEKEIKQATKTIEALREERLFGKDHGFKDPNYWRNWADRPAEAPPPAREPLAYEVEVQIKDLYRQLAREFHPDLAEDEMDQAYRVEKMAKLNEAYKERNLAILKLLAVEARLIAPARTAPAPASLPKDPEKALEFELASCLRRTREVEAEIRELHLNPSVQLSLDYKLARREGRDLLSEMAADLRKSIARKTVERDYLRAALDQLEKGQGG